MLRRTFLRRPTAALAALLLGFTTFAALPALAASSYAARALVSDGSVPADHVDPNLKNPWGVAFNPTGFVWVADNHSGKSTLYDGAGVPQSLVVTIPPASGGELGSPTGIVFSGSSDFVVSNGTTNGPSRFIFATEDGTIAGWAPNVDLNNALTVVATPGASYRGLAIAATPHGNMLFAADFMGRIDAFDASFQPVTTAGGFVNPKLHSNYVPFNIQTVGDQLYVMYAKRNKNGDDEKEGRGMGFVDVFDFDGHFVRRLIKHRGLNAPWGITATAPADFGDFSNALLIGNFGSGHIAAYDPKTGRFLGYLHDSTGAKLHIDGLWGMAFGNGVNGQDTNKLYFAAGVGDEEGGVYGSVSLDATR